MLTRFLLIVMLLNLVLAFIYAAAADLIQAIGHAIIFGLVGLAAKNLSIKASEELDIKEVK